MSNRIKEENTVVFSSTDQLITCFEMSLCKFMISVFLSNRLTRGSCMPNMLIRYRDKLILIPSYDEYILFSL